MVPDIESMVYSTVAARLRNDFTGIFVSDESIFAPPTFPAASLVEMDNSTYLRSLDSSGQENHAQVMYQAEAFSNLSVGKKSQCKAIMQAIDDEMFKMGFVRVGKTPQEIPNANASIYRIVSRYRAVVSNEYIVYHK